MSCATVEIAARHGVSITARGGGTSQAGQAIGAGLQLDTSKYLNRILEVNVAERWARVEPGVVLDELNAQLKPHGLRFAPDISTASRATVGGMIANNSSGARSVLYGKTIDHVLEQHVVLSDGSVAHFRPLDAAGARDGVRRRHARGRVLPRRSASSRRQHATRSSAAFRRCCGASAATTSTRSSIQPQPFNLAKLIVGSEGTLGLVVEAKINLVPLPAAKAVLTIEFADLLDALAATPLVLRHRPSAVEVMDRLHPRPREGEPGARRAAAQHPATATPARCCASSSTATAPTDLPPRLDALERDLAASGYRCRWRRAIDAGRSGAHLELPRGGARPVDGDEGRRQVAVVRRGHGGRAGEAARLHRAVPADRPRPRHVGRRLRARVGRLPARPAGRQPEDRRRRAEVRGDRQRRRRSRARVRRRAVGRARRRPGPQPVHREDVRPGALRGVPHGQADVRSRTASSIPARSSTRRR